MVETRCAVWNADRHRLVCVCSTSDRNSIFLGYRIHVLVLEQTVCCFPIVLWWVVDGSLPSPCGTLR